MTISSTTVKNSYSGNGTLDTFNYTFKVFADADLQVIIRDASATETVKTLTTHYTVTGAGSVSGGTIVFTAGNIPTATETVVIRRASPQTQAIDYIANDPFPAESHEEGLDRAMMTLQQLQEEVDRSIKLSRTNTMTSTEFAVGSTARAGKIFGFDDNGELVVSQELGTFKGDWSASTTYNARDIVKDTSTNNIFLCNTAHTSSGSEPLTTNTDSAKWDLLVDAESATTSATNAANSATAAATSATNAATSESNASTSETNAATSATNAASSATSAAGSATTATTQASAASTSASNAATSESNAATSASNASTSETNAATSATNASNAQTAAETAQAAAEAAADSIDDTYLGAKASNPTVDNDGDPLTVGDWYFNTTSNQTFIYNGSSWDAIAPDLIGDATPQLGGDLDLNSNDITGTGNINITGTATVSGDLTVDTDTLYVDSANNRVGIGETSPQKPLHIYNEDLSSGNVQLRIQTGGSGVGSGNKYAGLELYSGATEEGRLFTFNNDLFLQAPISGADMLLRANGGTIQFANKSGYGEAMRIDSSGNVGIGTSSPDGKLHIGGISGSVSGIVLETTEASGDTNSIDFHNLNGDLRMGIEFDASTADLNIVKRDRTKLVTFD